MRELVSEQGAAVIGEHHAPEAIVREAARLQPDAVVLALDAGPSRLLGARVLDAAPAARLIFWARDERVVEVQDRGSRVRRRIATAAADALGSALRGVHTSSIEGERCPRT
jgi:hypothetical protein